MNELIDLIRIYDNAYYVEANPIIEDREYDRLFKELQDIENKYPKIKLPDTPTNKVGGEPIEGLNQLFTISLCFPYQTHTAGKRWKISTGE